MIYIFDVSNCVDSEEGPAARSYGNICYETVGLGFNRDVHCRCHKIIDFSEALADR